MAKVNHYLVTAAGAPSFIANNQKDAYEWVQVLIDRGYAPQVQPYGGAL